MSVPNGRPHDAFILNQHVAIVSALTLAGVTGVDAASAQEAHAKAMTIFAETAIDTHARVWAIWVRKVEAGVLVLLPKSAFTGGGGGGTGAGALTPQTLLAALPEGSTPPVDAIEAEAVVRDLGLNWRSSLSALHEEARKYFGNLPSDDDGRGALAVLKALFSRFAEYHQRGAALLARAYPTAPPAWARELVQLQTIYLEMRRFGSAK